MYRFPSEPHGPQTQIWRKMYDYNSPIWLRVELTCTQLWAVASHCQFSNIEIILAMHCNSQSVTQTRTRVSQLVWISLIQTVYILPRIQIYASAFEKCWSTYKILMSAAWYFWHEKIKRISFGGGEGLLLTF